MEVKLNEYFVKHMLLDKGMSVREFAKSADVGEATMYRLLNGGVFTSETLAKIAIALQCHPVDLISATGFGAPHTWTPQGNKWINEDIGDAGHGRVRRNDT